MQCELEEHLNCSRNRLASFPLFPVRFSVFRKVSTFPPAPRPVPTQPQGGSARLDSEIIHRNSRRPPPALNPETVFVTPRPRSPRTLSCSLVHLLSLDAPILFICFLRSTSGTLPGRPKQLNIHPLYRTEARRARKLTTSSCSTRRCCVTMPINGKRRSKVC